MSTTAKWVIGIVIGLLIVAALAVFGFIIFIRLNGAGGVIGYHSIRPFDGQIFPQRPFSRLPGQRISVFLPLGFFLGRLIFPAFLFLIVIAGIILLFSLFRSRRPAATSVSSTATGIASNQATRRSCPNCERAIQDDWSHCPYCGTSLPES